LTDVVTTDSSPSDTAPISGATTHDMIKESVRELNRRREEQGTLARDEIIERK